MVKQAEHDIWKISAAFSLVLYIKASGLCACAQQHVDVRLSDYYVISTERRVITALIHQGDTQIPHDIAHDQHVFLIIYTIFTEATMGLNPPSAIKVSRHLIPAWHVFPNTSIQNKPLLIYHCAFEKGASASQISNHLKKVDVVVPQWQYSMYRQTHFHSTTHEVLSVVSGRARLCFGGEENPDRVEPVIEAGDVIIIPAGVAHRLLEDLSGGFIMVGSYPKGKNWDMCYGAGDENEDEIKSAISQLNWFDQDPIYGRGGPVSQA